MITFSNINSQLSNTMSDTDMNPWRFRIPFAGFTRWKVNFFFFEIWCREIHEDITFFKMWLKYYMFLSVHYCHYFITVLSRYHRDTFLNMIFKESLFVSGDPNRPPVTCVNMLSKNTLSNSLSCICMYLNARALLFQNVSTWKLCQCELSFNNFNNCSYRNVG